MIQLSEKIYSFEDYCQYNDEADNHYELVDGRLVLMNTTRELINLYYYNFFTKFYILFHFISIFSKPSKNFLFLEFSMKFTFL